MCQLGHQRGKSNYNGVRGKERQGHCRGADKGSEIVGSFWCAIFTSKIYRHLTKSVKDKSGGEKRHLSRRKTYRDRMKFTLAGQTNQGKAGGRLGGQRKVAEKQLHGDPNKKTREIHIKKENKWKSRELRNGGDWLKGASPRRVSRGRAIVGGRKGNGKIKGE